MPEDRVKDGPTCGRCKTAIDTSGYPIDVTDKTFDGLVAKSPVPVLVDVWAPWCGPCRMVGPVMEQIGKEYAGRLLVVKLNSDDNPVTSKKLKIRSIPALFVYKGGQMVKSEVGARPKAQMEALFKPFLD